MLANAPAPHKLTVLSDLHGLNPAERKSDSNSISISEDSIDAFGISDSVTAFLQDSGIRIKSPENTKELEFAKFLKHNVFAQIQREKLEAIETVTLTRTGQENILTAVCKQAGQ